jgi:hypothetical protein
MDQIARDVAFVADRLLPERDVQVTQPRDGAAQQDPQLAFRPERAVRPLAGGGPRGHIRCCVFLKGGPVSSK